MKAKDVLNLLRIARQTLVRYVKNGVIRVVELPNKQYDYNDEDVYNIVRCPRPSTEKGTKLP